MMSRKMVMYKWHILTGFVISHICSTPTSFIRKIKDEYTLLLPLKKQSKSKERVGFFFLALSLSCQWCKLWLQNFYYYGSNISRQNIAVFSDPRWIMSDWHLYPRFWFIMQDQNCEGSVSVAPPNLSFCWVISNFITSFSKVFPLPSYLKK